MLRFLNDRGCTRFLPLLGLLLVFSACSDDTTSPGDSTGDLPGSLSGVVAISCQPDFLPVNWTLTTPSGESVRGQDSAFMDGMPSGDYQISWAPLTGWTPPVPNPRGKTLSGGVIEFFGHYYPQPGTIHVFVEPAGLRAPWTLVLPNGNEVFSVGDTVLTGMYPGTYFMAWDAPDTAWVDPANSIQELTSGEGLVFTGQYQLNDHALSVSPLPTGIDAPWELSGPDGFLVSGQGNSPVFPAEPDTVFTFGDYTLVWGEVSGYETPESLTYTMDETSGYTFTGTYSWIFTSGTVSVDGTLHGEDFSWVLSGPENFSMAGTGDRDLSGLPPGEYMITWPETDGWSSPASSSEMLEADATVTFTAGHLPALSIIPAPEGLVIPWQVNGPGGYGQAGQGAAKLEDLATGSYTITWLDVDGWTTPDQGTGSITADQGLILTAEYAQIMETLYVAPEPVGIDAPWSITGPEGFTATGTGQAAVPVVDEGDYRLTWGAVDGMNAPAVSTAVFASGESVQISARYLPAFPMILVSSGTFQMGSPNDEACRDFGETRHDVTLSRNFSIQETEVTNAQYRDMAQWALDNGYATLGDRALNDAIGYSTTLLLDLGDPAQDIYVQDGRLACQNPDHPVKEITWYGAAAYCDWLSLHRGLPRAYNHTTWQCNEFSPSGAVGFRLPTEAEWERSARAGTATAYANGGIQGGCFAPQLDAIGWWAGISEFWTHPVGQLDGNNWGIHDMHGNVAEWCNDWYQSGYYSIVSPAVTDPAGPSSSEERVVRGGFFFSPAQDCRSAARMGIVPANSSYSVGFRVARTSG
jgi:formylglycine-generating enzyme required for sulfatase activity